MKHMFLNLKRFDVPREYGGVNSIADIGQWGSHIIKNVQESLKKYDQNQVEFCIYFPEAHILEASGALGKDSPIKVGCQGVYCEDVKAAGNFGAFTTHRPAAAMKALGCKTAIIGHCEERNALIHILSKAKGTDTRIVNEILNEEVRCAIDQGMQVVYCIGERSEEKRRWEKILGEQIEVGLNGVDTSNVVIAYEPIWSIGPGKIPADKEYITKIARFIKERTNGIDVIYGGGLKQDNAKMLASIEELNGGLIALTRFQGEIGFYPEEYLEIIEIYLDS